MTAEPPHILDLPSAGVERRAGVAAAVVVHEQHAPAPQQPPREHDVAQGRVRVVVAEMLEEHATRPEPIADQEGEGAPAKPAKKR